MSQCFPFNGQCLTRRTLVPLYNVFGMTRSLTIKEAVSIILLNSSSNQNW